MNWLSIIVPTYNRANLLNRALASCVGQSTSDYEIIVVDDGSTDNAAEVALRYRADHVRMVRLDKNVGVSAARMAGVRSATGEWLLFLDSDDELMPNSLPRLKARTLQVPPNIMRIASRCIHDDGHLSPEPWTSSSIMDYRAYLEWSERAIRADFNNCIRRTSFAAVQFPCDRVYEAIYHLDFAQMFETLCCGEVTVRVHDDADERLTRISRAPLSRRLLAEAEPRMRSMRAILDRHGEALRRFAPSRARMFSRAFITAALMAQRRDAAFREFVTHICRHPLSYSVWGLTALGIVSPRALVFLIAQKNGK